MKKRLRTYPWFSVSPEEIVRRNFLAADIISSPQNGIGHARFKSGQVVANTYTCQLETAIHKEFRSQE